MFTTDIENLPRKAKKIELEFVPIQNSKSIRIPFTEIPLAGEWGKFLQGELQRIKNVMGDSNTPQKQSS